MRDNKIYYRNHVLSYSDIGHGRSVTLSNSRPWAVYKMVNGRAIFLTDKIDRIRTFGTASTAMDAINKFFLT